MDLEQGIGDMHKTLFHRAGTFSVDMQLPVFFPSISSVKANLRPVEYLKFLVAVNHPQFLVSAYDLYNASPDDKEEIRALLKTAQQNGQKVLLDSGNYEAYWHQGLWSEQMFFAVLNDFESFSLSFSFDEQDPPSDVGKICQTIKERADRHLGHIGEAIYSPIVHAPIELLSDSVVTVAKTMNPKMIAVPERLLGRGILERIVTIKKIRAQLNKLEVYYPLHLLGTGNPMSVVLYIMGGADSFDGLEWCQTTVDHQTGLLHHFQLREVFTERLLQNDSGEISYVAETLAHNLKFFGMWMSHIHKALGEGRCLTKLIERHCSREFLTKLDEVLEAEE